MIHSCTVQKHQVCFHRQLFCQTCKTTLMHYRACGATGECYSELVGCQTPPDGCPNLSCGLCTSLLPAENTAPLSVCSNDRKNPPLACPPTPTTPCPPPTHPLMHNTHDITRVVKNYLTNQQ